MHMVGLQYWYLNELMVNRLWHKVLVYTLPLSSTLLMHMVGLQYWYLNELMVNRLWHKVLVYTLRLSSTLLMHTVGLQYWYLSELMVNRLWKLSACEWVAVVKVLSSEPPLTSADTHVLQMNRYFLAAGQSCTMILLTYLPLHQATHMHTQTTVSLVVVVHNFSYHFYENVLYNCKFVCCVSMCLLQVEMSISAINTCKRILLVLLNGPWNRWGENQHFCAIRPKDINFPQCKRLSYLKQICSSENWQWIGHVVAKLKGFRYKPDKDLHESLSKGTKIPNFRPITHHISEKMPNWRRINYWMLLRMLSMTSADVERQWKSSQLLCHENISIPMNISLPPSGRLSSNWPPTGNGLWQFEWWCDWWCHVTLKGQGRDPNMFGAHYLINGWRYRLCYSGVATGNGTWVINWSRAWWCHVNLKSPIYTWIHIIY